MKITKALIVADPWIGYILDGSKTWEMRSGGATHRGRFGLIRKGTGAVYGVARLVDVGEPLSPAEMISNFEKHRIPEGMIHSGEVAKWNTPWKLADVRRLAKPVPYRHRSGAVTWVALDDEAASAIAAELWNETHTIREVSTPEMKAAPIAAKPVSARLRVVTPLTSSTKTAFLGDIVLTAGNIRNSHIYLRDVFHHFPDDAIGGSNRHEKAPRELTVDWGGASPAHTDLDGSKKLFRGRGWIKAFFESNDAAESDKVRIEETSPYSYSVRFIKTSGAR